MCIVGVTGGIASGKTTVTGMFAALGAVMRSADADARAVLADGSPVLVEVLRAFPGARNEAGGVDRAALAARIFADARARTRLEAIMHPAIIGRMREAIAAARATDTAGVLVYETPLLFEAGLEDLFDVVVAVFAPGEVQAERLQARERGAGRPPLSDDEITRRLQAQLSSEEKARRADYVIRTDVPLSDTEAEVGRVWAELTSTHAPQRPVG
jgi:dephospho-CoA kinase